ncbi:hypothetical protein [Streptomyces coeruleofuscus]|uniref:Uncharacterized protein n=1 Tax=Streptomyces coeruleofuscus TaxID=66879 RepID=A0ABP5VMK5_9ACTN
MPGPAEAKIYRLRQGLPGVSVPQRRLRFRPEGNILHHVSQTAEFWIRASDGSEAEISADETGILVERPDAGGVFAIVAELVAKLEAVIIDPSTGRAVCRTEERAQLPASLQEEAIVIDMTGDALEAALSGATYRAPR